MRKLRLRSREALTALAGESFSEPLLELPTSAFGANSMAIQLSEKCSTDRISNCGG